MNKDDKELIAQLMAGEKQAWKRFESGDFAKLIFWAMCKPIQSQKKAKFSEIIDIRLSKEETIELHRDILCKIIENLETFEGRNGCSLKSWVRTIAVNKTIDYLKKGKLPTVSIDDDKEDDDGNSYSDSSLDNAMVMEFNKRQEVYLSNEELRVLLDLLDEKEKQFAEVCFDPDENPEEIAKNLNITIKNYYVRKNRLMKKLEDIANKKKIR